MGTMVQCETGCQPNDEQTSTDEQTNKRTMNEQMNVNKCERNTNILWMNDDKRTMINEQW